jgi:hypothetical protein
MRRARIVLGLATAVCVFGALSASAFAAPPKEPTIFGEFTASITGKTLSPESPGIATGHGEVETLKLAGRTFECEKEMKSKALVTAERSSNFTTEVKLGKCYTEYSEGGGFFGKKYLKLKSPLLFEFHSNGSANAGSGEADVIIHEDSAEVKLTHSECSFLIPDQTIPLKAAARPEDEYESATYETESESVEGGKLKKYPSGFHEELDITMEFKGIKTLEKPTETCFYKKGEEGKYNPETGYVEIGGGIFEGELEEIKLKGGNIGFEEPKA